MSPTHIFTAFAAALGMIAMAPNAMADDGENSQQASSQRTLVAKASAKIVRAETFSFSSPQNTEQDEDNAKNRNSGRSEIVRDCKESGKENTPAKCTDMHIIDLH